MECIGIDLHKANCQVCILAPDGTVREQRIRTDRGCLSMAFRNRSPARILLEASTESEWVARLLEQFGHDVIVADPNFAPMYATRTRRVKTDRRDARALADACRLHAYRRAHRCSDSARQLRRQLVVRETLVRTRTRLINVIRATLRTDGIRVPIRYAPRFLDALERLAMPEDLPVTLAPLAETLRAVTQKIAEADTAIRQLGQEDPTIQRLCTVPGVGPVTAATFVAVIDEVGRFETAHALEAYLGLVPRERSSGERQARGRITKSGNTRLRSLLVEAAWALARTRGPETVVLRTWASRIAVRRGQQRAMVALARKLAGILFALWRDGTTFAIAEPIVGTAA
jgi:transposase